MKTSLELFHLNVWKYPLPDNNEIIDYDTETLWYQWQFWNNVVSQLSRNLNEVPTDPLTDKKYIFSTANNKNEFEILTLLEWDVALNITSQTNAANLKVAPRIDWTYNGVFVKTATYIVPVPSLITSEEITWWLTLTTDNIKSQIVNNWENIPNIWNVNYNTWALTNLTLNATGTIDKNSTDSQKLSVYQAIYDTYSWTTLANDGIIKTLLIQTTQEEKIAFTETVVLKKSSAIASSSNWDETPPVPVALIDQATCESANWMWVDTATDVYIWTTKWEWFCISPRFWDWNTDSNLWNWWISWNGWWNYSNDYYNWWNASSIDDSLNSNPDYWQTRILDSEVSYNCKALWTSSSDFDTEDNIVWRMKWLATTWNTYANARSIEWITGLVPHTIWTNPHAIPALYIADCIDWEKDLWTDMDYKHYPDEWLNETITYDEYKTDPDSAFLSDATYQDRQKYLTAWTQETGSHLPSAFSYISDWTPWGCEWTSCDNLTWNVRWEYQVACEASLLIDASDDVDNERIWLSAVGTTTGTYRGRTARIVGNNGCGDQRSTSSGNRDGDRSARFVVRP